MIMMVVVHDFYWFYLVNVDVAAFLISPSEDHFHVPLS